MKRKVLSLLLVMAMGMSLLVGCGDENKDSGNDTNISQTDEDEANIETAVISDVWSDKKIEISYNKETCEKLGGDEYVLSVAVDSGEAFDIDFHADYTASSFYGEETQAMEGVGLKASDLSDYSSDNIKIYGYEFYDVTSDSLYSCTVLHEVEGGIIIVHSMDFGFTNEEIVKAYTEKVFVSAKIVTEDTTDSEAGSGDSTNNKIATTNEEKALVYKADYEAIKDKIVSEEKDRSEASYYDANGLEIMYVYYDGENISDVFFMEYDDNGVKKFQKVYAFDESGTYGIMEFEYHENGEGKTETVYNEDGAKFVFYFDESGDYVDGIEYDKDGNVVE